MKEKYGIDQVSIRMVRDATYLSEDKIQSPKDAIRILGDVFRDYDREVVGVVHLKNDHVPINMTIVSIGCLNKSIVHPRELLKAAFLSNAAAILMFHNHPGGSLEPSKEDIALTNRMQQVCMMAGIPIVDHIIIGRGDHYYSFCEKDVLPMDDIRYSTDLSDVDLKAAEKEAEKYGYKKSDTSKPKKSIRASLDDKRKIVREKDLVQTGSRKIKEPEL